MYIDWYGVGQIFWVFSLSYLWDHVMSSEKFLRLRFATESNQSNDMQNPSCES